jgi:alkylation response protein AidB-like acyl-CoA dehydrogenase
MIPAAAIASRRLHISATMLRVFYRERAMNFELTPLQQQWHDRAVEFARTELQSDVVGRDESRTFWRDGWSKCAEFGVQGLPIPVALGGQGCDAQSCVAAMMGLGYACRDQGLLFAINAHLWTVGIPLLRYGSAAQQQQYLPGLCDGTLIGANGATEPNAGSDIFAMETTARRDGESYVLNGRKRYVTNGPVADVFAVYATLDPAMGALGICAFLVDRGTAGFHVGENVKKMGMRTTTMSELKFDDCRIPATQLLGREGRGVEVFNCSMAWERACILATCVGIMRRQVEQCVRFARGRKQFRQSIGKFQSVANRIVDMKVRLETSRILLHRVAWLIDEGRATDLDSALAKLCVSESFVQSCLDAVQVHGAAGYMTELELERELRDSVASTLYSGTSEIQRNIIARELGL